MSDKIIIACINIGIGVFCCIVIMGGGLTARPLYGSDNIMNYKFITIYFALITVSVAQSFDTVYVNNKGAVFYCITQEEFKTLRDTTNYELDELIADFFWYFDDINTDVQLNDVSIHITRAKFIKFSSVNEFTFTRDNDTSIVGLILFDGVNDPKIFNGVYTSDEWSKIIKEFFKLE